MGKEIFFEIQNLFGEAKSKFYFKNYKITCIAKDKITLPFYKGSAFRGSFGLNLKRVSCFKELKDDCKTCEFKNTCVYPYIFESTISKELPIIGKVKDIPRPLVIEPPLSPKRFYKAGVVNSIFTTTSFFKFTSLFFCSPVFPIEGFS